jgi:hypothetical protein
MRTASGCCGCTAAPGLYTKQTIGSRECHSGLPCCLRHACPADGGQVRKCVMHRASAIAARIKLYIRFTLSFRDVEDLLAERGIMVSYETVRRLANHFGPMVAADLRKRRPKHHTTWHLDEVYLKIDGRMVYLCRGFSHIGK